ncbi:LUD domain-containing protein [Kineosporia sp. A_224]|uniref:LutC/YkgG family protein n=1 Tax=Kineosporia sp. A_224 TaxID=1962180 RepID=UPI000B4AF298|nr:LUD domain-containing protein [Kineosporia sp. A_224]
MTTSARDEVLRRIRTALGRTGGAAPQPSPVPRDYRTSLGQEPGAPGLLDLLVDRLVDYKATVHRCAPDAVGATVAAALAARGARRLAAPSGLPAGWLAAADVETVTDGAAQDGGALPVATLDAVDGVVTGCAVAVAQTGTIVLDSSPDCGRRALTLVPDYHLIVVRADQVVGSVPEALPRLDPDRPLTWVSGPSATSDIELDRVEGVHGPRTLVVVLVEG